MSDWLSSLRSASSTRTPVKNVARNSSSITTHSRQVSFQEDSVASGSTRDDTSDTVDSRMGSRSIVRGKSADLGFPKTPRRKGLIPSRPSSISSRNLEPTKEGNSPPGSPRATSVQSADDCSIITDDDLAGDSEGDCVQVCVRVRPVNDKERADASHQPCIHVIGTRTLKLFMQKNRTEPHLFHYDNVFTAESSQQEVFEVAGYPVVENCLNGYNSTIFAYGQTGAGKTYTMLGHLGSSSDKQSEFRGLAPRVFEYLFNRIAENEDNQGRENIKYSCRCSFLEIYNETITDLLNPSATNLQIREDIKKGCYVDGLSEESVVNVDEMLALMKRGADNRHVGETRMNRESSRSHSVFTCTLERCSKSSNGLTNIVFSRLNLIDLAGSERQKKSEVAGSHLKEACHINKSLTILGRVIHELVEAQRSGRKSHIPYRDSRLTFLLQDSLGGNAKTWIIANISPSSCCSQENLSTLQFAQRAKRIRNRAVVNMDTRGDVAVLQKEIIRLNQEIHNLRGGVTDAYAQENAQLRAQLKDQERQHQEVQLRLDATQTEVHRYKRERDRAEAKMHQFTTNQAQLLLMISKAEIAMKACQVEAAAAHEKDVEIMKHEAEILQTQKGELQQKVSDMEVVEQDLRMQLTGATGREAKLQTLLDQERARHLELQQAFQLLQKEKDTLLTDLESERGRVQTGCSEIDRVAKDLSDLKLEYATKEQQLAAALSDLAKEQEACDQINTEKQGLEAQLDAQSMELSAAFSSIKALRSDLETCQADLVRTSSQLAATTATCAELQCNLDSVNNQLNSTSEQLLDTRAALLSEEQQNDSLCKELEAVRSNLAAAQTEIQSESETTQQLRSELSSTKAQLAEVLSAREDLEQQVDALNQQLVTERDHHSTTYSSTVHEWSEKVDALEQQLKSLSEQLAAEREQYLASQSATESEWSQKAKDLQQELQAVQESLQGEQAAHEATQAAAQQTSKELQTQIEDLTGELASTQSKLEAEAVAHAVAQEKIAALTADLEALRNTLTDEQSHAHDKEAQLKNRVDQLSTMLAQTESHLATECTTRTQAEQTVASLTQQLKTTTEQLADEKDAAQDVARQLAQSQERNADLEEEVRNLSQIGTQLREQLAAVSTDLASEQGVTESLQSQCAVLEQTKEALELELAEQKAACHAAAEQIAFLTQSLQKSEENSRRQCEEMQQILANVKQEYEDTVAKHTAQIRNRIEESRHAEEMHQKAVADLEARLSSATQTVQMLTEQKCDLLATLDEKLETLQSLQQENTGLKEQLVMTEQQLEEDNGKLADALTQITKLSTQLQETQEKVQATIEERNNKQQELEVTRRNAEHAAVTASQTQRQQQKQIEALQRDLSKALEELARKEHEMKQQVQSLTAALDNTKREAVALQSTLTEEQTEIKHLKGTLAQSQAACIEATQRGDVLDKTIKDMEKQKTEMIATYDLKIKRLSTEMQRLEQDLASARERLDESYKENTSGAVQMARLKHAFVEMRRVIDAANLDAVTGAACAFLENTPPPLNQSIRAGALRPPMSMSPSRRHTSPCKEIQGMEFKDADLAIMKDQIRGSSHGKIAQQLRVSLDGIANILKESSSN